MYQKGSSLWVNPLLEGTLVNLKRKRSYRHYIAAFAVIQISFLCYYLPQLCIQPHFSTTQDLRASLGANPPQACACGVFPHSGTSGRSQELKILFQKTPLGVYRLSPATYLALGARESTTIFDQKIRNNCSHLCANSLITYGLIKEFPYISYPREDSR